MKKILKAISAVLSLVAMFGVAAASFWLFYQPKTPKCLEGE